MDFIDFEASEDITDNEPVVLSDEEDEINNDQIGDFIDDTDQQREGVNFYKRLKPKKFPNQIRNPENQSMRMMIHFLALRTHSQSFIILWIENLLPSINLRDLKVLLKNLK